MDAVETISVKQVLELAGSGDSVRLLDLRDREEFAAAHIAGAVCIPLSQLGERIHELPRREELLYVVVPPGREAEVVEFLGRGGRTGIRLVTGGLSSCMAGVESGPGDGEVLWEPAPFLVEHAAELPRGRILDLAMGSGRNAVFLAGRGYDVYGVDILPDAVRRALDLGAGRGVCLRAWVGDLSRGAPFREGSFEGIICFRYLERGLFPEIERGLKAGGVLIYETFVEPDPGTRSAYRLGSGELRRAFPSLECLLYEERSEGGRSLASLIARRP